MCSSVGIFCFEKGIPIHDAISEKYRMSWSSLPRGYDKADGTPMNPFQNESFMHAAEGLTKN